MTNRITQPRVTQVTSWSPLRQLVARHPAAAFLVICYAVSWLAVLPPLRVRGGLPFHLGLWESLATIFGVALAAFLVLAASGGRAAVSELARRCLRWRVGARWYLVALAAMPIAVPLAATAFFGVDHLEAMVERWPLLLTLLLPRLLVGIVLFNVAEEIGWMGFLQARWQDRYGPLKAALLVTVPFTLYHLPVFFVENGLRLALAYLPAVAVVHLGARVVMAWLYNHTHHSVLLVGLFHSSFDATVLYANSFLPAPAGTYIGFGIILLTAVIIAVATRGRLAYHPSPVAEPAGSTRRAVAATGTTLNPPGS